MNGPFVPTGQWPGEIPWRKWQFCVGHQELVNLFLRKLKSNLNWLLEQNEIWDFSAKQVILKNLFYKKNHGCHNSLFQYYSWLSFRAKKSI